MDTCNLSRLFDRHTRQWHFWLRDLRTGETVECGTRQPYPIGSCFKLAVLMAYFWQAPEAITLERENRIPPERFRTGGGVVNFLDSAITLTDRHLLHWMLAASDGTATDWLMDRLGLDAVNTVLKRHAPDSHLAMDLGDMVTAFRQIPGALDCKTRAWTDNDLAQFTLAVCALGATHAEDLAHLALAAWRFQAAPEQREDYQRCLKVGRTLQRTKMFIEPALLCFTKTGSIGRSFTMNDCGVLIDPQTQQEIACFGYCSYGWRVPSFMTEVAGGLIGIEIARMLGLNPVLNADWTPEGAALLMGET